MMACDCCPRWLLISARLPNPKFSSCQTSWTLTSSRPDPLVQAAVGAEAEDPGLDQHAAGVTGSR